MKLSRALQAAALQITATAVFAAAVALLFAPVGERPIREALSAPPGAVGAVLRVVVGVMAAFIAGWWGARGLSRRWIEQGLLIGVLIAAFAAILATIEGKLGARTNYLLLLIVAAVAGSIVARLSPLARRAFIAAAAHFVVLVVVTPLVLMLVAVWLTPAGGGSDVSAALLARWTPWSALVMGLLAPFAAGWWAARGLQTQAVKQGLITGAMIAMLRLVLVGTLGREMGVDQLADFAIDLAAAVSGAAFAGARRRADSA